MIYRAKASRGFSFGLFLITITLVLSFVLFVPMPRYDSHDGWFQGSSIANRIMGNAETKGTSIEAVYYSYAKAKLQSPFALTCQTDLDCKVFVSKNQCKTYCANQDPGNDDVLEKLEQNRVCDPASYRPQKINCECVLGSCTSLP